MIFLSNKAKESLKNMLDIKFIRENREIVELAIQNKKVKGEVNLDKLFELADQRNKLRQQIDELNQKRNEAAKIKDIETGKKLKGDSAKLEENFKSVDEEYFKIMIMLPNIPSADTPIGPDESANKVIREYGEKPQFDFEPKEHDELGKALDIIDIETAIKVSGPRFTYIKGDLALMQIALLRFGLDTVTNRETLAEIIKKAGIAVEPTPFTFILPPNMIKPAVLNRMGRLEPREDRFHLAEDDLYLAGSAEHALGPMYMDHTFKEAEMPMRLIGYATSFRREAGSYGKDTKGIIRMHQFDKLEMETFCLPETSRDEQELLIAIQEYVMQKLELPYQVIAISTGDMGTPDHRQVDINTWMPGQGKYRETHTSDLMTSFQSRRLNTKVKRANGQSEFVHMNDATLFSMRPLIAILENYQQADGSIKIPKVLVPYMGKEVIVHK